MARYSSAYSGLIRRLDEIEAIISIARRVSAIPMTQPNPSRVNALCRGGIVLLCSHVEGYVEDLGAVAINSLARKNLPKNSMSGAFKYHLSRDLIDDINRPTDPEAIASRVDTFLARDTHIWDATPNFTGQLPVETFVGNFATARHDNIGRFFRRFGYQNFQNDLVAQLQSNYLICRNMVDHVVDQRNKIAHGDFVTAGTPADLQDMCRLVRLYCRSLDKVVGDWFKSRGCSIR